MMRSIMYGAKSNDLEKYCEYANCQKRVTYNNLKTGANDPSISQKALYAKYVRGPTGKCTMVLDAAGNIVK